MKYKLRLLLAILAFALIAIPGHSATTAITPFDPGAGFGSGLAVNVTTGFRFTPNQDIYVQELGFWDKNGDGLGRSYSMGIVDTSSNVLGTATVPAGVAGRFEDVGKATGSNAGSGWRYAELDGGQLQLLSGVPYAVVATLFPGTPDAVAFPVSFTADSAIAFGGLWQTCCSNPLAGTLHYPAQFQPSDFVTNFTFTDQAVVPLPAAAWLFGSALLCLVAVRKKNP